MRDRQFCSESQAALSDLSTWWEMDGKALIGKIKKVQTREGRHGYLYSNYLTVGDKMQYQTMVFLLPPSFTPAHATLAGFIYDNDYLKNKFFPMALNEVLPDQNQDDMAHHKGL